MKPLPAILYVLTCLAAYYSINYLYPVKELWIYQILFFLVPALTAIYRFLPEGKQLFSRLKPAMKPVVTVFGLSLIVSFSLNLLISLWGRFFPVPEDLREHIKEILHSESTFDTLRLVFTVGLLPAICEETLFRGFLQNVLKQTWSARTAILAASLMFAGSHLNPWFFPFYVLLGIFLGWCQHYRNNLYLPVLAHWVNNLTALVLFKLF